MSLAGTVLALALSALPYPAPRQLQPTPATKCDRATVLLVDAARGELRGATVAGVVTYRFAPDVPVFGKDGKPAGSAASLARGAKLRVYYVLEDGAKVQEIDLVE